MTARSGSPAATPGVSRRGRSAGDGEVPVPADRRDAITSVGAKLRERRLAAGVSLRQFARDLGVSPSLVSQIENGKSQPSVATLYLICSRLDVSIDELFSNAAPAGGPEPEAETDTHTFRGALAALSEPRQRGNSPVVEPHQRRRLVLDSGVTWEQLSAAHGSAVDFLLVRYEVGGSSVPGEHLTRHSGIEYGYIISGTLDVSLGFETYRIGPGDAISFDSATPHRLTNNGDIPVAAIWFVHGRNHDV
ncbi:MAG TPA: helix-turn-helix domain-containing protein [Pseudonocardiaceae bacterium]|nr:helix-turn-helix domain-containing protein [Pseudonocardiaceae bacterium]